MQLYFLTYNITYTRNHTKYSVQRKPNNVPVGILYSQGERVADFWLKGLSYILKIRQQLKYKVSEMQIWWLVHELFSCHLQSTSEI